MIYAPQEEWDTTKENIWIVTQKLSWDIQLSSFYQLTRWNLESVIPEFELIDETVEDEKVVFSYKGTQAWTTLQREQTLIINEDVVYVFTYTAIEETFDNFAEEITNIVDTFKLN